MKKIIGILIGVMMLISICSMATLTTNPITPNAVCVGSSVTVSYSGACSSTSMLQIGLLQGSCAWQNVTTFATTTSSGSVVFTVPSTYTYSCGTSCGSISGETMYVRIWSACSSTNSQTITVYSSPPLQPTIGGPASACVGALITLTGGSAVSYLWNTGATTSSIIVSPNVNTTYSLTEKNACGTSQPGTKTINVIPTPTASITPSQTICSGNSVTITASGGTSYSWSTSAASQSISVSPTSSNTSYWAIVSNGCSNQNDTTQIVQITVNPTPTVSISGIDTICNGQNTTLFASGASTYVWFPNGQTDTNILVSPTINTTYTVIGTSASGCTNASTSALVVNPLPTASISITQSGNSATLIASGTGSYLWSTAVATQQIVVSPSVTTIYTLTVTNQCGSATDSIVVVITPPTGIFENTNHTDKVSVFPNPADNEITISANLSGKDVEINIYSIVGEKVLSTKVTYDGELKLGVSQMKPGNYIVEISTDGFHSNSKLVIVR